MENVETKPYIKFDVWKVREVKKTYGFANKFLLESLPDINFNSSREIKEFFLERLSVEIPNIKIATINDLAQNYYDGSEERDFIETLVCYLRQKYTVKNYIDCILTHEQDGYVFLRFMNGRWVLPNRQPLSYNEEIRNCIVSQSPEAEASARFAF